MAMWMPRGYVEALASRIGGAFPRTRTWRRIRRAMSGRDSESSAPAPDQKLHEQAVRFLTTLRAEQGGGDDVQVAEEHRDFLKSKGLDDAGIERARAAAARPNLSASPAANQSETSAFDRAAREFDMPLAGEGESWAPPPPAPAYPRSPLALYSSPNDSRTDSSALLTKLASSMSQPRYDVLIRFFRTLQFFLMLGGAATAVGVALFRKYLLPRLAEMIDARLGLVRRQREQFGRLAETMHKVLTEHLGGLLPDGYEPERIPAPREEKKKEELVETSEEQETQQPSKKRVSFADEHPEKEDGEKEGETDKGTGTANTEADKTDAAKAEAETDAAKAEADKTDAAKAEADKKLGEKPAVASERTEQRKGVQSGEKDSAADDAFDELEPQEPRMVLAPIDVTARLRSSLDKLQTALQQASGGAPVRKVSSATAEDDAEEDEDGLLDLSPPEPGREEQQRGAAPPSRGMQTFRTALDQLRGDANARILDEEEAHRMVGSRFANTYGSQNARPNNAAISEMMQIKAEVRSLKGILLSRYVVPEREAR